MRSEDREISDRLQTALSELAMRKQRCEVDDMDFTKEELAVLTALQRVPRNEWGEFLQKAARKNGLSLSKLSDTASNMAVIAAEFGEYVDARGGDAGMGDRGHDEAAKRARSMRARVRKAIGYTIP